MEFYRHNISVKINQSESISFDLEQNNDISVKVESYQGDNRAIRFRLTQKELDELIHILTELKY